MAGEKGVVAFADGLLLDVVGSLRTVVDAGGLVMGKAISLCLVLQVCRLVVGVAGAVCAVVGAGGLVMDVAGVPRMVVAVGELVAGMADVLGLVVALGRLPVGATVVPIGLPADVVLMPSAPNVGRVLFLSVVVGVRSVVGMLAAMGTVITVGDLDVDVVGFLCSRDRVDVLCGALRFGELATRARSVVDGRSMVLLAGVCVGTAPVVR